MQVKQRSGNKLLLSILVLLVGFVALFFTDNIYQAPPPYGVDGVLELREADVRRSTPLFLVNGWQLTDNQIPALPSYMGQFWSSQRINTENRSSKWSNYELTLRYHGSPLSAVIFFPQFSNRYIISYDGAILSQGSGSVQLAVPLTEGDHLLRVDTVPSHGYYSGMPQPAALGTAQSVSNMLLLRCIAYGVALFAPLVLTVFSIALWYGSKDRTVLWFFLLCCCFCTYVSHYFVWLLRLPAAEFWYLVQLTAFYGLCICVLWLTALTSGADKQQCARWFKRVSCILAVTLLLLPLLNPIFSWVALLHAILTNLFFLCIFGGTTLLSLRGCSATGWEKRLSQLACICFDAGLVYNLVSSQLLTSKELTARLFAPIHFFWPFEWCGLLLVALFGAMMVVRNRRILAENTAFKDHLEDMVLQRTTELEKLLRERKAFFADMAHDLKAPIFAVGTFIQAMREHGSITDRELQSYIDQVEQKHREILNRVQGLTLFNRMDESQAPYEAISIQALLAEILQNYRAEASVQAVHLLTELPEQDGFLYAQPKKLEMLFENLIFNALRATPQEGCILVKAVLDQSTCYLTILDTGCGIPDDELPFIFDRFYVGRQNVGVGSGIGLYIVQCIVTELKGHIRVTSTLGQGTSFFIDLPLMAS